MYYISVLLYSSYVLRNVSGRPYLSRREKKEYFFCQKVLSLSSLIALLISHRHLSSRLQQ